MTTQKFNRRDFLRTASLVSGSALLAACGQKATEAPKAEPTAAPKAEEPTKALEATKAPEPTKAPEATATTAPEPTAVPVMSIQGPLTIMYSVEELTDEQLALFTAEFPDLQVERLTNDDTRMNAMFAAGTPPDAFQLQGKQIGYLRQNLLLDLDGYLMTSEALKLDDLASCNSFFQWDGDQLGSGKHYGMAKDWSPDFSMWANPDAFAEAGLNLPDDTSPLRYQDLTEMAAKLTKKAGDRTDRIGMTSETWTFDAITQFALAEVGKSLYSPDFTQFLLKDQAEAVEAVKLWFQLAMDGNTWTPLNPSPNNWNGKDFALGLVGLAPDGYWFSGFLRMDETFAMHNKAVMLPAPTWGKQRYSPAYSPSGMSLAAASQNPDAAWKFFEFANAGQPAIDRAKSGWGVPALLSLTDLLPQETDFDKQCYKVVQDEIANAAFVRDINPYFDGGPAFDASFKANLELALRGDIDFDQMIDNMQAEVQQALDDGILAAGG